MKKPILIFLASVFLLFLGLSTTAMASPYGIEVNDVVMFTDVGPSTDYGTGGEFTIEEQDVAVPFIWTSFCVEKTETIDSTHDFYVGGLTDRAIGGGNNSNVLTEPGYDLLSQESAWLFWHFSQGTLLGYDSSDEAQEDLQLLLWHFEDEITLSSFTGNGYMNSMYNNATSEVGLGWTNNGRVAVVNLYKARTLVGGEWVYDISDRAQDQLVAAPIPPAVLLLASGLLGLIGLGRFRFKK